MGPTSASHWSGRRGSNERGVMQCADGGGDTDMCGCIPRPTSGCTRIEAGLGVCRQALVRVRAKLRGSVPRCCKDKVQRRRRRGNTAVVRFAGDFFREFMMRQSILVLCHTRANPHCVPSLHYPASLARARSYNTLQWYEIFCVCMFCRVRLFGSVGRLHIGVTRPTSGCSMWLQSAPTASTAQESELKLPTLQARLACKVCGTAYRCSHSEQGESYTHCDGSPKAAVLCLTPHFTQWCSLCYHTLPAVC